jgi:hypothetical protein
MSIARITRKTFQDWTLNDAKEVWLKQKWRSWKWQDGYDGADKNKCWNAPVAADGAYFGSSAIVRSILINDKGWHDQNDIMIRPNTLPLETFRIRRGMEKCFFKGSINHE